MDFEEYFSSNFNDGLSAPSKNILKFTFEAGQKSKQEDIDALNEKINKIARMVHNETGDYYLDEKIKEILHDT